MTDKIQIGQTSSFSGRTFLPVFYSLMATLLIPATVWYIFTSSAIYDIIGGLVFFVLLTVIWIVFVWGELRLKAVRIYFREDAIECVPFLGWGRKTSYSHNQITGYKIMLEPALPLPYESIILVSHEKELLQISQFYFRNYEPMKSLISDSFDDLGSEKFSTWKAFTNIFKI